MMTSNRGGLGAVLAAFLLAAAPDPAHAQGESKCSAQKVKAAAAYFTALSKCRSKAVAKAETLDPECAEKASQKLANAIAKAEAKGDCLTLESELPVTDPLAAAAAGIHLILAPTCCALAGARCTWLSEAGCTLFKGTLGAPGSVCSGSGACIAPPAQAGPCCEDASIARGLRVCVANAAEGDCTAQEGNYSASALCRPNQTCVAP